MYKLSDVSQEGTVKKEKKKVILLYLLKKKQ